MKRLDSGPEIKLARGRVVRVKYDVEQLFEVKGGGGRVSSFASAEQDELGVMCLVNRRQHTAERTDNVAVAAVLGRRPFNLPSIEV